MRSFWRVRLSIFVFSLALPLLGWTHDQKSHSEEQLVPGSHSQHVKSCGKGCTHHTVRASSGTELSPELEEIQAINLEVHESLHEHGEPGFTNQTKAWLKGLNVLDFAMRSSLLDRKSRVSGSDHWQNIVAILVVTHVIELAFGPASVSTAVAMDAPGWVVGGLATVGALISIPMFVDPLCWMAYAAYCASPRFRKSVSNFRGFVLSWRKAKNPFEGAIESVQALQQEGLIPQGVELWEKTQVDGQDVGVRLLVSQEGVEVTHLTRQPSDAPIWTERKLEQYPWSFRRAFGKILSGHGEAWIESQSGPVFVLKQQMFALKKQECLTLLSGTAK